MTASDRDRTVCRARHLLVGLAVVVASLGGGSQLVAAARPAVTSADVAAGASGALSDYNAWRHTGDQAYLVSYLGHRDSVIEAIADGLGIDVDALRAEWTAADPENINVVLAAVSQLGVPYRSYRSKPGIGFDCSGLTSYAYAKVGIDVPRNSSAQIAAAEPVDRADVEPGDLLHRPGHVGIYVGAGAYVHSPQTGKVVEVTLIDDRRSHRFGDFTN